MFEKDRKLLKVAVLICVWFPFLTNFLCGWAPDLSSVGNILVNDPTDGITHFPCVELRGKAHPGLHWIGAIAPINCVTGVRDSGVHLFPVATTRCQGTINGPMDLLKIRWKLTRICQNSDGVIGWTVVTWREDNDGTEARQMLKFWHPNLDVALATHAACTSHSIPKGPVRGCSLSVYKDRISWPVTKWITPITNSYFVSLQLQTWNLQGTIGTHICHPHNTVLSAAHPSTLYLQVIRLFIIVLTLLTPVFFSSYRFVRSHYAQYIIWQPWIFDHLLTYDNILAILNLLLLTLHLPSFAWPCFSLNLAHFVYYGRKAMWRKGEILIAVSYPKLPSKIQ